MMRFFFVAALFCVFGFRAMADQSAAPRYAITNLTPDAKSRASFISAEAINNKGEIAGSTDGRAFLWRNGELKFIGRLPGSDGSNAADINDAGQIVGTCRFGEWDKKYFFWQNGKMQDLGEAPMIFADSKINNVGQVLLHNGAHETLRVVFWQNGKRKDLGSWWGWDINDNGQIVGAQLSERKHQERKKHDAVWAVVWENGLAVSAGGNGSVAMLINNKRDILISADSRPFEPGKQKMFFVSQGEQTEVGKFNEKSVAIYALNDQQQMVGSINITDDEKYEPRATIWQKGRWHHLNDLIPANSGWVLKNAKDINERGQIIGEGT